MIILIWWVEWLRIRTNPDKVIFEYDKSIGKREDGLQDYAQEYETEIKQPDELRKILDFLGKLGIKVTENDITKTGYPVLLMNAKNK